MLNDKELRTHLAMEALFLRFDTDKSGTLEVQEMLDMFKENQIEIRSYIIKELFKFADSDGSG